MWIGLRSTESELKKGFPGRMPGPIGAFLGWFKILFIFKFIKICNYIYNELYMHYGKNKYKLLIFNDFEN